MTQQIKIGFAVCLFVSVLFDNPKRVKEFHITGYAQGTTYAIKYFASDSVVTKDAVDSILLVIDSSMSLYKSYSTINKFNQSEKGLTLDSHFSKVIERSFEIYEDSKGLFDITVAPLLKYWGFGPQRDKKSTTVRELLPCIGMDKLKLNGNFLSKEKQCTEIDVNGIAQGYAVDVVATHLLSKGISAFIVEIGGEIRSNGPKPDGSLMKIGIEGPSENPLEEPIVQHVMSLGKGAVTTSGNYRNYLVKDQRKISHLIDPKTGEPLLNEMVSVTVYAPDAITADGYDNVLMAMHMEEALSFVNNRNDLEAYIIYKKANGKLADTASVGFTKMMVK